MQNNLSSDEVLGTPVPFKLTMPPSPVREINAGTPGGALSPYRDDYALHMPPSEFPTPMRTPAPQPVPTGFSSLPPSMPMSISSPPLDNDDEDGIDAETLALARQLQAEDERYFAEQQEGQARYAALEAERLATPRMSREADNVEEQEEEEVRSLDGDGEEEEEEEDESLALAWRLQREDDDRALLLALNGGVEPPTGVTLRNVSPSQMTFDQLTELGNNIGCVSKGASVSAIEALPTITFDKIGCTNAIVGDQCAICRLEFEGEDLLRVLPCRHAEHAECLDKWLVMNRCCPLCLVDVANRADDDGNACTPAKNNTPPPPPPTEQQQLAAPAVDPNSINQDDLDDIGALLDL